MIFVAATTLQTFFANSMNVLWLAAIVVFLVVEAATAGLTCIWLAIGSLAALVASMFGAAIWLQVLWFFVVTFIALYLTRPLVKKFINSESHPTNADMVIGMKAAVIEDIDNIAESGAVSVAGKVWTARAVNDEVVHSGSLVLVERIEGVKLMVSPIDEEDEVSEN